jgi:hypothetical protein
MASANVLINGVSYGWSNTTVVVFGVPLVGITNVEVKEKQVKENNYGSGVEPIARGYGNVEYDASIQVYAEQFFQWVNAVTDGRITKIPPFNFPMTLVPKNAGASLPQKVVVRAAEFMEASLKTAQGDTKILIDLPLIIAGIDWK